MQDTVVIICPYCGASNEIFVDVSAGHRQHYQEDCQVCCRPWEVYVEVRDEIPVVTIKTDED
jgi:sarcosine oxidase delta subunit